MRFPARFALPFCLLFGAPVLLAAELEAVVISAQQVTSDAGHEAVAQTTLSQDWINDLYVDTFEELSFFVPGLYVQEQSINSVGYAIRGMTSNNPEATRTPRVSVWLHDMDISRSQGAYTALYDIEQVDVFKGPVGSLFARGGQIGGVNISNHLAELESGGSVNAAIGSYNELKLQGHYNQPLSGSNAVRLAVYSHQRDGFIDNLDGTDLHAVDTQAGRLSFLQMLGDTRLDIQANIEQNNPSALAFQNFAYPPGKPFEKATIDQADRLQINRDIADVFARASHPFSDTINGSASVMWRDVATDDVFDPDGTLLDLVLAGERADYNTLETVMKLEFTGDNYTSTLGVGYFYEDVEVTFSAHINEQLAIKLESIQTLVALMIDETNPPDLGALIGNDLFDANGDPAPYTGFDLTTDRFEAQTESVENDSTSVFSDHTWYMHPALALSLGLRYSQEHLQTSIFTPPFSAGGQPTITSSFGNLFLQPQAVAIPYSKASDHAGGLSGRLSFSYFVSDGMTLYATYARGRRPDILNFTEQSRLERLADEVVDSWETGFRLNVPETFSQFDMAAYYYDFRHFATQFSGVGALQVVSDDNASASVTGLEMAYTQFFAHDILLFANLTWNDARFDESAIIRGENRFRYAPELAGAVSLSKDFALGTDWRSRLTWQESFQSEVYFEDDNGSNLGRNRQGSYGLMNIGLDVVFAEKLILNAFVKNATNKEYIVDAGNFGQLFGLPTFVPGMGRHVGAGVSYLF